MGRKFYAHKISLSGSMICSVTLKPFEIFSLTLHTSEHMQNTLTITLVHLLFEIWPFNIENSYHSTILKSALYSLKTVKIFSWNFT